MKPEKKILFLNRPTYFDYHSTPRHTILNCNIHEGEGFENILAKRENAGNQPFLFSPTMFPTLTTAKNHQFHNIYVVVCKCFQFGQVEIFVVWQIVN